jgi:hypothetical protein
VTPLDSAWRAVFDDPASDAALAVLADAMLETGDVQGEVIRLQLEGRHDEAYTVIAANASGLLGEEGRLPRLRPSWRRGFIDLATVTQLEDLQVLLGSAVARLMRGLTIEQLAGERLSTAITEITSRAPATLRRLQFGVERTVHFSDEWLELEPVLRALPAIESIDVRSWPCDFSGVSSAHLTQLAVTLEILGGEVFSTLSSAHLPALTATELSLPFERVDFPVALLAGTTMPRLRSLIVRGVLWPEQVHELSLSALLKGLSELRLSVAAETNWHEALVESSHRFSHLRSLEIRGPRAPESWEGAVRDALPHVTIRR